MLRITAPHFVAGIEPGKVCAPIIRYMLPWSEKRIRQFCAMKGWRVSNISFLERRLKSGNSHH
jgi:hypothetical protein